MTKNRTFTCGLDAAIAVMGGKWKGLVLFALQDGPLRFGELRRAVPGISERVLILQLREMETTGLLHREVYHQVPPKVEYSLTAFGESLNTAMAALGEWGEEHLERIEALPWSDVK
ncbi:helix-turn-helix domain-containing protein [Amycolatopsis sp. BJA-103]|uniref:winged helix-turn-helix transcriptional regulator n=1 Tax=Amycolatopsis sp. BJA-103 TaxID=1911175 RepID=UPI000C76E5F8|nr:helix-turn-helix domain-containing protein [Amycolatopsis sp. BJA-103]AUI64177.1 transcriptional regulator [Amycolatopsis sp. BJA-103]PNE15394.1 transcriptional regulator [Amycolatopsis sp. BJA-103]